MPLRAVCTDISWITALTNRGAEVLAAKGYRIDPTNHKERYRRHKSYNAILHDLNRTDFLVELDAALRSLTDRNEGQQQTVPIIRHQDELLGVPYTETISFPSMAVWKKEHRPLKIEPDGIFSLTLPNFR